MSMILQMICGKNDFEGLHRTAFIALQKRLATLWGESRFLNLPHGQLREFLRTWLPFQAEQMVNEDTRGASTITLAVLEYEEKGRLFNFEFEAKSLVIIELLCGRIRHSEHHHEIGWRWTITVHLPHATTNLKKLLLHDSTEIWVDPNLTTLHLTSPNFWVIDPSLFAHLVLPPLPNQPAGAYQPEIAPGIAIPD